MGWNPFKAIGDAISGVVRGVVDVVKSVVSAVTSVVSAVVGFVVQPFMNMLGGAMPNAAQEAERQQGVTITKMSGGDGSVPVVYGLRQVGGQVVFYTTGSDSNKYLWVLYVLSEGPIEGVYDIAIDDEDVTTATLISNLNSGVIGDVDKDKSRYTAKSSFQLWHGDYKDIPSQLSTATGGHLLSDAPGWKSTNVMNGCACLMARYEMKKVTTQAEADNNPFRGGVPNIKITIMGRKVASLIDTNQSNYEYGAGGYVERYSTNPAECLLDYLRNPRYGKGLKNSEIHWDSFQKAANKFNQNVDYITGVNGPILTCNFVLDTGSTLMSNTKLMLTGMRSYMPYIKGKYKLKVEDAGNETDILSGVATVVKTFTKDTIIGNITYGGVERTSKYTSVEVTYVSPTDKWATTTITYPDTEAQRLVYVAQDGGRENKGAFTFPTLTNYAMAYDMARLIFEKSRIQQTLSLTAPMEAMELEPGDNINVTSNVLNFVNADAATSVPWRIVSIKLNQNYTYQIDCVRNPDSIYPHARANERDIILAPYIPRGASIYFPSGGTDLGMFPPGNKFVLPGQTTGLNTPGPSNITGTGGGGVGGTTYTGGSNTPIIKTPTPNPTDYITVDEVTYTVVGSFVSATIKFRQPSHPMYAGVDFWYKRSISTEVTYITDFDSQKANPGDYVYHTFNNLYKGNIPYILISRVRYINGDNSVYTVNTPLNVSSAVVTENPADFVQTSGPGWQTPLTTAGANPRNTQLNQLSAVPSLGSSSERKLTFSVTQDINISGLNTEVNGINIYYRLQGTTYFAKYTQNFDSTYIPGAPFIFTPTLGLGIGNPSPDDASDNFDFIFRLKYKDDTESTKEWRYMGADVSNTSSYDPFAAVLKINEDAGAYTFQTTDQQPPGTAANVLSIVIGIKSVGNVLSNTAAPGIVFNIEPPSVTDRLNWYGVRVYYRAIPVIGGVAPSFTKTDYFPVNQPSAGVWQIIHPISYDTNYQYLLVPIVNSGGTPTPANQAWLGQGSIHNRQSAADYPNDGNWFNKLSFTTVQSATFSAIEGAQFPTSDALAKIISWNVVYGGGASYPTDPNKTYFSLTYDLSALGSIVTKMKIYRRQNVGVSANQAKYYGIGRWEVNEFTPSTSGPSTVSLRAPIDYTEFNPYFGIAGSSTSGALLSGVNPWTAANKVVGTPQMNTVDFIVVLVTSTAGTSAKGMLMPKTVNDTASVVTVSTYDGLTAGYYRNISEARSFISNGATLYSSNPPRILYSGIST
jgi:hypothetical protein